MAQLMGAEGLIVVSVASELRARWDSGMTVNGEYAPVPMRLRYAGTCRSCAAALPAGTMAVYDRSRKTVLCSGCSAEPAAEVEASGSGTAVDDALQAEPEIFAGVAGASAKREFERRSAKREARIREAHPKIGGLMLALSENPQSTKAWAVGAVGEEKLGRRLDGLKSDNIHVLHDRLIPGTKANIDHIVVCPSGVFVIDTKKYKGRPSLRVEGGFLRERTEKLMVGSRDCTKLAGGVQTQVARVVTALGNANQFDVPVAGMLCFVEADWPLLGGEFSISGVDVLWPKRAVDLIRRAGPIDESHSQLIFRVLAEAFPAA